jgi:hypothetical protein
MRKRLEFMFVKGIVRSMGQILALEDKQLEGGLFELRIVIEVEWHNAWSS